jgi:prevent-host-death family protein
VRSIKASEFTRKCLRVVDEVDRTGEPVTITKRGRPIARLVSATASPDRCPQETLSGSVEVLGEIVGPALPATAWDAVRRGPLDVAPLFHRR